MGANRCETQYNSYERLGPKTHPDLKTDDAGATLTGVRVFSRAVTTTQSETKSHLTKASPRERTSVGLNRGVATDGHRVTIQQPSVWSCCCETCDGSSESRTR